MSAVVTSESSPSCALVWQATSMLSTRLLSVSLPLSLLLVTGCESEKIIESSRQPACVIEYDGSYSESADGVTDKRITRSINARGQITKEEFDTNGDGGVDQFAIYSYNSEGHNYLYQEFGSASGMLLSSTERAFDQEGRIALSTEDRDGDGIAERFELTSYPPQARVQRVMEDWNKDGQIESEQVSTFGIFGITKYLETSTGTFATNKRILYAYNEQGLEERQEHYEDGELSFTLETSYTRYGQKAEVTTLRADNSVSVQTFSHDERGFITGWVRDEGRDGSIESRATCTFDSQGRMLSEHMDYGNDGIIDSVFSTSFDEEGRRLHEFTQEKRNGANPGQLVTFRYDCQS